MKRLVYPLMLALAVGLFFVVQHFGAQLSAPPPTTEPFAISHDAEKVSPLAHALLAIAVVVLVGRALGWLLKRAQQPAVIGEMLAGIVIGPSVLGWLAPQAMQFILPPSVAPLIGFASQLGIIVYMFIIGLSMDHALLRSRGATAVAVSHASIVLPFSLGMLLALIGYPRLSSNDVPFPVFALFMGVSLSITAFPVLARILTDRNLHKTPLGVLAMACAAADDVTAWLLLAFVVAVAKANATSAALTLALTLAFLGAVWFIVRPPLSRYILSTKHDPTAQKSAMTVALLALIICALCAEAIGIHAVFGAFLLGSCIPHDSAVARRLSEGLEPLISTLLLPCFFAFTGMRTELTLVTGTWLWGFTALVIATAIFGKVAGATTAARLTGNDWRTSLSLGILMNTRGLMELIVLNIGLQLHVLSPAMFAVGVLMALVTTLMTGPLLSATRDRQIHH